SDSMKMSYQIIFQKRYLSPLELGAAVGPGKIWNVGSGCDSMLRISSSGVQDLYTSITGLND
ncbi:hypothetical protein L9F63_005619, partial [Diploptera punctata]